MSGRRNAWAVVVSLAVCTIAHAQAPSADDLARARTHFEAGRALYNLGNYSDALREFSAGHHLVPKPQFLINLGQCYRKLNDLENARKMYAQYLEQTPASDPERAQVQSLLSEVERELRERPRAAAPVIVPADARAPSGGAPSVNAGAPSGVVLVTQPPPRRKPFVARHWWIFPVGAVALAGLAVGLYFGLKPADCTASLGCIPVHGQ
ncbi:MAG TPA: tetratricopeptide repeat protein [Polyangia bacterium]|nr:tetratricopeptide repeat protein [Polyangia bacterium]